MAGVLPRLAPAQTFPSGNSATATTQSPLSVLRDFSTNQTGQAARDAAALRLVAPRDADAKSAVLELFQSGPDESKLALARALAEIPWPDPDFQQPLMALFGQRNEAAGAAAATALAQYRNDPAVMQLLIDQARSGLPGVRVPAIRALGSFGKPAAADTLIGLLQHDKNGSDATREAAGDALIEMTGRTDLDHNAQLWQQWRDSLKTDQQFDDAIMRGRATAYEDKLSQHDVFDQETNRLLTDEFYDAPPEKRAAILLGFLQSPAPEIRVIGAGLVLRSAHEGEAPPGTIQKTRQLLSDPSPEVRAAAATALSADFDSAGDLVAQLKRENDDYVRVRIIRSLARFANQAAIEQMLDLVGQGQSDAVREAAADGIRDGSVLINSDPALKKKAIDRLKVALVGTTEPEHQRLREAITGALAQIKDQQLSEVFFPLLLPEESDTVRANALIGLGNLPNPAPYASQIARMFDDPQAKPPVRLAAAQALTYVPPAAYITIMLTHLQTDPDDQVKTEAWNVLQDWAKAPDADEANLITIADGLKYDPGKELTIRQLLSNRLDADARNASLPEDRRKDAARQRAEQEQNIGDLAMQPAVNQPPMAIQAYKTALDYWKQNNGQFDVIKGLSVQLVRAYLADRNWEEAANFASQVVKDYQNDLNKSIPAQVAREFLVKAAQLKDNAPTDPGAYRDAMQMFDAVEKMNPPLPGTFPEMLRTKRQDWEQEHAAATRPGA
jgi:HEAT repeat protein